MDIGGEVSEIGFTRLTVSIIGYYAFSSLLYADCYTRASWVHSVSSVRHGPSFGKASPNKKVALAPNLDDNDRLMTL